MSEGSHQAGKSTRAMAEQRRRRGIYWGIGGILVIILIFIMINNPDAIGLGGGGILGLLVLMKVVESVTGRQMDKQYKLRRRAVRGAKGEEKVGELLDALNEEDYVVVHDVACAYGNIDHVVLSREKGIFLIETKAHGGQVEVVGDKLLVNGKDPEKDFIAQTLRNTYWLRQQVQESLGIKAWVQPVIVFTNSFVKFGKPVKGIYVTNKKYLLGFIQSERKSNSSTFQLWEKREDLKEVLS
jgi:hypothetical protein